MAQAITVGPLESLLPVKASPAQATRSPAREEGTAAPADGRTVKAAAGAPQEGRPFSAFLQEAASGSPPAEAAGKSPAGGGAEGAPSQGEGQVAEPETQPEHGWPPWLLNLLAGSELFSLLGGMATETAGVEGPAPVAVAEGTQGAASVLVRLLALLNQDPAVWQELAPEELPAAVARLTALLPAGEGLELSGAGHPGVKVGVEAEIKASGPGEPAGQAFTLSAASDAASAAQGGDKEVVPLSQAGPPPPSTELYQRQAVRDGMVRELTPLPDPLPAADETPEQAGREPLLSASSQGKVDLSALLKGAAGSEQAHLFREHRSGSQEGGEAFPWTAVWLRAGQPEAEAAAKVDLQPLQLPSHHRLAGEEPLAEKVLSQLIHRASVLLREGGSEMRLQLIPESLGRVAMHIAVEHGTVTARFAVANEQVKNLIEAQLPQLRQALEEQGLRVDSFSVSCQLGGEERPWPGQEQVATQGWTPGSEGKRAEQAYESSGRSVALVRQGAGLWGAEGVIDALV